MNNKELVETISSLRSMMMGYANGEGYKKSSQWLHERESEYGDLRSQLLGAEDVSQMIPGIVKIHSTLRAFEETMKADYPTYKFRREAIKQSFSILDLYLEEGNKRPSALQAAQSDVTLPAKTEGNHAFISYSRSDSKYAEMLESSIKSRGVPVWKDNLLVIGDIWWTEIERAITQSKAFILIMSSKSSVSEWVRKEVHLALDLQIKVLPLLLSGDVFSQFKDTQYEKVSDDQLPSDAFYHRIMDLLR